MRHPAMCAAAALVLAGCGGVAIPRAHPHASGAPSAARLSREAAMNQEWQDRTLHELVMARGRPVLVMQIPGGGNPPSFAVVYGVDRETGCIDAFAVSHGEEARIRVYHCR